MKKLSLWNQPDTIGLLDPAFKKLKNIPSYLIQGAMAFGFLWAFLLIWDNYLGLSNKVVFAAIGSSVFLVFSAPSRYTSTPRPLIFGHAIGILVGILMWETQHRWLTITISDSKLVILTLALAVGLSLLLMTMFDAEHPPAAGTAMAFAAYEFEIGYEQIFFVMVCATILAIIGHFMWKHKLLKDLI